MAQDINESKVERGKEKRQKSRKSAFIFPFHTNDERSPIKKTMKLSVLSKRSLVYASGVPQGRQSGVFFLYFIVLFQNPPF